MSVKCGYIDRTKEFYETLNALGENLLKSPELENHLDYYLELARRQKKEARLCWWRRDWVDYHLNKSDYHATLSKIAELRNALADVMTEKNSLEKAVKDCYVISEEMRAKWQAMEPEDPVEDPFVGTDEPVDLGVSEPTQPFPPVNDPAGGETPSGEEKPAEEQPVEGETPAKEEKPVEGEIDDAS